MNDSVKCAVGPLLDAAIRVAMLFVIRGVARFTAAKLSSVMPSQ